MSIVLYDWLASGSTELAGLTDTTLLERVSPNEREALKSMFSQVESTVIEPILNHGDEETLDTAVTERIPIFWSYLRDANHALVRNYSEKAGISGIVTLLHDDYRFFRALTKAIRPTKERIGREEGAALLAAVRALWEYDSLILSWYMGSPRLTEQAILGLDLSHLQETISRVCLPIVLSLAVINEIPRSEIRLRNAKRLALESRKPSRELLDYVETIDILLSPTSARFEAAAEDDLARQRFADLGKLAKRG